MAKAMTLQDYGAMMGAMQKGTPIKLNQTSGSGWSVATPAQAINAPAVAAAAPAASSASAVMTPAVAGTGGAGAVDYQGLINSWQAKMDAANAANEARYGQISSLYDKQYGDVMGKLEGMGAQSKADLLQQGRERENQMRTDLTQRGLGNTTVMPSMASGINRETTNATNRLDETLRGQQADYMRGMQQGKMDFMERRNDVGPDYNTMLNLLQQAGTGVGSMQAYGGGASATGLTAAGGLTGVSPGTPGTTDAYGNPYGYNPTRVEGTRSGISTGIPDMKPPTGAGGYSPMSGGTTNSNMKAFAPTTPLKAYSAAKPSSPGNYVGAGGMNYFGSSPYITAAAKKAASPFMY